MTGASGYAASNPGSNYTTRGTWRFDMVAVNGTPSDYSPDAVDDDATTPVGQAVSIPVLANDFYGDGTPVSVSSVGPAAHGTTWTPDGASVVYQPASGFVGVDRFTYTVTDGHGNTSSAEVTVEVLAGGYIGSTVWGDRNADGLRDADESGMPDIRVELYNESGEQIGSPVVTDSEGHYRIPTENLEAGYYRLRFVAPDDEEFAPQRLDNAERGSKADPTGWTPLFLVNSGLFLTAENSGLKVSRLKRENLDGVTVTHGKLLWTFAAPSGQGNRAVMRLFFRPDETNTATRLAFIQVVKESTIGGRPYTEDFPPDQLAFRQLSVTDPAKFTHLDTAPNANNPYYAVNWDAAKTDYIAIPGNRDNRVGNATKRPLTKIDSAGMSDSPAPGRAARKENGDVVTWFETAVFAIDTQQVLGVITWGFMVPSKPGFDIKLYGATDKDVSTEPSAVFKGVIANAVNKNIAPMRHAQLDGAALIVEPKKADPKFMIGGVSALT